MKVNNGITVESRDDKRQATVRFRSVGFTIHELHVEARQGQIPTNKEIACLEGHVGLGSGEKYLDNSDGYPPEVLRLLEVICEVILEAASSNDSHTDGWARERN